MEELLNKLIEKGWKPFGYNTIDNILIEGDNYKFISRGCYSFITNIRLLVSKESGLWQFVCENKMVVRKRQGTNWLGGEPEKCFDYKDYEYRIIESALCDEEDLDKFLLENIKIS